MANLDITYCKGKKCGIRDSCKRYLEGRSIAEALAVTFLHPDYTWWMENCNEENREGYIKIL